MSSLLSTVAAISTPPGSGGIAVIRISGRDTYSIVKKVFIPKNQNKSLEKQPGYSAVFGTFIFREEEIDDGLALCFRAPRSYTGEDVIELNCHGGEAVSRRVLAACYEAGAEPAGPGEFTKRAVLNGKMDLTQAEGVMDLISAVSPQELALARSALSGRTYTEINSIRERLLLLAGHLTALVDYPEEGVEALEEENFIKEVQSALDALRQVLDTYETGQFIRRGVRTAIVGSPNVGKSTLFNLLSNADRAIVTPQAGTTRDVISEEIQLGGLRLILSDTAGVHETEDEIEAEGIRRSWKAMEEAGLIIAVFDISVPLSRDDLALAARCEGKPALAILNKTDLVKQINTADLERYFKKCVSVSAASGNGLQQIEDAVLHILKFNAMDTDMAVIANERQKIAVIKSISSLENVLQAIVAGLTFDAAGVCLEDALSSLGELTGENVSETIINDVFSRFCVGK